MNESATNRWIQLTIRVAAESTEAAEEALFAASAASVTLLDAADHPVHEPDPGETPLWPQVLVRGLFGPDLDRAAISERLRAAGLVHSADAVDFENLADQDWERAWMDRFGPMRFGRDLWICPSHLEPDPEWSIVIRLDPGLAFGSGTHPTTALCLEWIDSVALTNRRVIDFGCGSGVLAIAAALKGASTVLGVDHDPQALTATRDNARRNAVAAAIRALSPDDFRALESTLREADLVVANILAGPLIELAPVLAHCVRPGGHLVLSGILAEQAEAVAEAYQDFDAQPEMASREDWVRLVFHHRINDDNPR